MERIIDLLKIFKKAWIETRNHLQYEKKLSKIIEIDNPKDVKIHPRYDKHIKYGFTIDGKHYYRFLHDYDIFESRFKFLSTFYQEVENKMTSQDINEFSDATNKYIEDYEESLHLGEPKPHLLAKAKELQKEVKYRSTWLFEPTSLYKYASVLYFDLQEDITDYDVQYNHDKIILWSKKKTLLRTFLKELMENADGLLSLSKEDFNNYLSNLQKSKDNQQILICDLEHTKDKKSTEITI